MYHRPTFTTVEERTRTVSDPGERTRWSRLRLLLPVAAGLVLVVSACSSTHPQSSLNPKGAEAHQIDELWRLVLGLATFVFVVVNAALLVAIVRFRQRKGDATEPKQIHGNTRLEIAWTILPAVVLAVLAVPTVQTLFDLRSPAEGDDVLTVRVTGHQWWWEFEYPDFVAADGRTLKTANELHIPAGVTTNLELTSADVIHSFWVPPLNGKRDLVTGEIQHLKLTPDADLDEVITGQCAEYCWLGHADMRFTVHVQQMSDFEAWAAAQLVPVAVPAEGTAAAAGYATFTQLCTVCHQAYVSGPDGIEEIGTRLAPDLTHFGGRETMAGAIMTNTTEHLASWIDNPSALKPMAPDLNDLANLRILGMPDYGLDQEAIANVVALLEGWE
jgi:cytochrome c oxidase subunit 2